ncbi:YceI family protein [Formosa sp. S-31]|uniref:YceI family protein n=1 Tax=Formosa sp. S-31 TaxID=2790949 RepID=UPI003EBA7D34
MKKGLLTVLTMACIATTQISCKNDTKKTEATAAEPVAVADNTAVKYKIDTEKSTIEWKGFKPTGTHFGTIKIENGVLNTENGELISGTALIDMNSINVLDAEGNMKTNLEAHLKGTVEGKEGDFFNVTQFPSAAFEITGLTKDETGKDILSGNLALKGIKKNVSFPVTISKTGDQLTLVSEPFTIDRTQWGINFKSKSVFDDLGDKFINDDIELKITVNAI